MFVLGMYICSSLLEWNKTVDEQKAMFSKDVFSFQSCLGFVDNVAFPTTMCDRPRTAVETPMPRYNNHFFIALTLVARGGKTTKAKLKTVVKYGMNCTKIK